MSDDYEVDETNYPGRLVSIRMQGQEEMLDCKLITIILEGSTEFYLVELEDKSEFLLNISDCRWIELKPVRKRKKPVKVVS